MQNIDNLFLIQNQFYISIEIKLIKQNDNCESNKISNLRRQLSGSSPILNRNPTAEQSCKRDRIGRGKERKG